MVTHQSAHLSLSRQPGGRGRAPASSRKHSSRCARPANGRSCASPSRRRRRHVDQHGLSQLVFGRQHRRPQSPLKAREVGLRIVGGLQGCRRWLPACASRAARRSCNCGACPAIRSGSGRLQALARLAASLAAVRTGDLTSGMGFSLAGPRRVRVPWVTPVSYCNGAPPARPGKAMMRLGEVGTQVKCGSNIGQRLAAQCLLVAHRNPCPPTYNPAEARGLVEVAYSMCYYRPIESEFIRRLPDGYRVFRSMADVRRRTCHLPSDGESPSRQRSHGSGGNQPSGGHDLGERSEFSGSAK